MTIQPPKPELAPAPTLTKREANLIKAIRLLYRLEPSAPDEIEKFVWDIVGRHMKWSYDDAESCQRSMEFAGLDPFLKRESDEITAECEGRILERAGSFYGDPPG